MKKLNSILPLVFRTLLGAILLLSGILKVIELDNFSDAIEKFNLVSKEFIPFLSYLIPLFEILLGFFLIINFRTYHCSIISMYMISFFTAIVTAKIFEGAEISCQCFGNLSDGQIDWYTILRNSLLIILSLIVALNYYIPSKQKKKDPFLINTSYYKIFFLIKKTIFGLILFFLAVQSIILSYQNRGLKNSLQLLTTKNDVLEVGDTVISSSIVNLDDEEAILEFNSSDSLSLIFIMSTECEPCSLNIPFWITLSEKLKNFKVNIYGIAVNNPVLVKKYFSSKSLNFNTYYINNEDFKINYKGFVTPQTLIIGKSGLVLESITGILDKKKMDTLLKVISLGFN